MPSGWCQYDTIARTLKLTVHVQPNARTSGVAGAYGDALKIRIAAPAVDGKANDALVKFIAVLLGVPPAAVVLTNGSHGRRKILEIRNATQDLIAQVEAMSRRDTQGR
jgi:uncharacterized protein (TIGR00251 family)